MSKGAEAGGGLALVLARLSRSACPRTIDERGIL